MGDIVSAAVYVFAKNDDGEWCVLCGRRSGNNPNHQGGLFDVPVGMREYGENPKETAIREAHEEAGITIPQNKLIYVGKEYWGKYNRNAGANFLCIFDKCQPIGGGDFEHDGFMWLPIEDVDSLNWAFGIGNTIKNLFSKYINNVVESRINRIVSESIDTFLKKELNCQV